MGRVVALTVAVLGLACLTPQQRQQQQSYFRTHPMEECRKMLGDASVARGFRNSANEFAGRPLENGPIDPCSLGCRIPKCGYPPAPEEAP